ncbi:hypothetical protein EWY11_06220 [Enterococcus faecalis]|nr:hypothetical protein [Enterococcus faecalis]
MTLHRIFKEIDPTIELTKSFLFLGGIKIALYKFPFRKNELIGLNGSFKMLSLPGPNSGTKVWVTIPCMKGEQYENITS